MRTREPTTQQGRDRPSEKHPPPTPTRAPPVSTLAHRGSEGGLELMFASSVRLRRDRTTALAFGESFYRELSLAAPQAVTPSDHMTVQFHPQCRPRRELCWPGDTRDILVGPHLAPHVFLGTRLPVTPACSTVPVDRAGLSPAILRACLWSPSSHLSPPTFPSGGA